MSLEILRTLVEIPTQQNACGRIVLVTAQPLLLSAVFTYLRHTRLHVSTSFSRTLSPCSNGVCIRNSVVARNNEPSPKALCVTITHLGFSKFALTQIFYVLSKRGQRPKKMITFIHPQPLHSQHKLDDYLLQTA